MLTQAEQQLREEMRKMRPKVRPIVGPTTFKILWTVQERLGLKQLRATDAIIEDFLEIIEDPRAVEFDMSLPSTADGVEYALGKLATAGVIGEEDIPTRKEEILSGKVK